MSRTSRIAAAATALPEHRYSQREITAAFADVVLPSGSDRRLLHRLHAAAGVSYRHLALPLDDYVTLAGFGAANDAFIRIGLDLGERAVRAALEQAGVEAGDVDLLLFTSVTGLAAPSLDTRLVARLGLRPDVRRIPMFGLGCAAGAAGIARLHDFVRGDPDAVAVLLSVELCSLTWQRDDTSMANLVASGLFGDAAAAAVVVGERRAAELGTRGPRVVASRSRVYPETERLLGMDVGGSGLRVVLAAGVADAVEDGVGLEVMAFLEDHGLKTADIVTWLAHPGGPKVLEAMSRSLDLPDGALERTRRSLDSVGNLSSASVLHVLEDALSAPTPAAGSPALMLAMGPGFASEAVLLQW